jgi:uncharacterized protein (DUF433 family)
MVNTDTGYAHVDLRDDGVAMIAATRYKVAHLAQEQQAWGLGPEQLRESHPDLALGQIYSALAYYADHQPDIDAYIAETDRLAKDLSRAADDSPPLRRLRALKRQTQPRRR